MIERIIGKIKIYIKQENPGYVISYFPISISLHLKASRIATSGFQYILLIFLILNQQSNSSISIFLKTFHLNSSCIFLKISLTQL